MITINPNSNRICYSRLKYTFLYLCSFAVLALFLVYSKTQPSMDTTKYATDSQESFPITTVLHKTLRNLQNSLGLPKLFGERKLILLWTAYFSVRDWLPSTDALKCPVRDCDITSNRSLLADSSAVILHWRNVDVHDLPHCEPSKSRHCPLWVLFNKEAPPHTPKRTLVEIQDKVHWTVTYRRDSDIFAPYGKLVLSKKMPDIPETDPNRNRTCWLVSNCNTPTKRELFVKELQTHMQVDVYGKCGTQKCPFQKTEDCYKWLAEKCKIYLSLENSNCRDYVTEKLYNALASGMIPVVKGKNVNYAHLPPSSYINADDFAGPKELAEYLKNVTEDRTTYESYHRWRNSYRVEDASYRWLCDLCKKLQDDADAPEAGRNLTRWWFDGSGCTS